MSRVFCTNRISKAKPTQSWIIFDTQLKSASLTYSYNLMRGIWVMAKVNALNSMLKGMGSIPEWVSCPFSHESSLLSIRIIYGSRKTDMETLRKTVEWSKFTISLVNASQTGINDGSYANHSQSKPTHCQPTVWTYHIPCKSRTYPETMVPAGRKIPKNNQSALFKKKINRRMELENAAGSCKYHS